jgi:hypothetical protein
MSSPSILKKVGDKASDVVKTAKELPPGDSEDQGIKEYQKQANALAAPVATAEPPVEPGPPELVNPLARYGSRQGEHRYTVDENGNLTPIVVPQEPAVAGAAHSAPTEAAAPRSGMKPIIPQSLSQPMPVYDKGGDVRTTGGTHVINWNKAPSEPADTSKLPTEKEGSPDWKADQLAHGNPSTPEYKRAYDSSRVETLERPSSDQSSVGHFRLAHPEQFRPVAPGMPKINMEEDHSMGAPVYDNGGDVKIPEDHKMTVKAEPLKPEDYLSRYGSEAAVANRPDASKPTAEMKPMPLYDDGGEVDVNDGKHQAAILQEGEQVLKPDEAAQYRKEHPEKTQGAPVGYPGMVLPNEKGVKPEWDSEHKAEDKVYPGGARMNIDNAAIGEGDQDAKTFPTAIPTEATAKMPLKPHSQVIEEQAKAKAAEQVNNPNPAGQPSTANTSAETLPEGVAKPELLKNELQEKPKPTYGDELRDQWLKKMGANNPIAAESTETQVQPKEEAQPSGMKPIVQPEDHQEKAGGPLVGGAPSTDSKDTQRDFAQMKYKAQLADYDKQYQSLLDQAAKTNDPALREQAARVKEAKLEYQKANPWGSQSNHPGVLGKIGHVAEMVASRAPGLAPIMATMPQSEIGMGEQREAARGQVKEAAAETTARDAAEAKEKKASDDKYTLKEVVDTRPDSPTKGQTIYAGVNNTDPTDVRYTPLNAAPKSVAAGGDKAAFEKTLAKTGNPDVADAPKQREAIDGAHASGRISDEEYAQANAYLGATANAPSTQASAEERKEQTKAAKAYYTYTTTDENGKKTTHVTTGNKLDELPEDAQLLPVKDISALMGEARSMNAVQDSMNELHKDLHDHPEVFDNGKARAVVQAATNDMNIQFGALVAGTGGSVSIPKFVTDMINTGVQNNALDDKTARAVKNYIADYKAMKDKAMVIQMAMQNGKMGRGGQQAFASIVNQVPGGTTADNVSALRQMAAIQRVLSGLNSKYPEEYADYKKTEPYALEEAAPEGTAAAEVKPKSAAKSATKPTTGYSANNPFAPKK